MSKSVHAISCLCRECIGPRDDSRRASASDMEAEIAALRARIADEGRKTDLLREQHATELARKNALIKRLAALVNEGRGLHSQGCESEDCDFVYRCIGALAEAEREGT